MRTLLLLSSLFIVVACSTSTSNKKTNENPEGGSNASSGGSDTGGGGGGGSDSGGGGAASTDTGGAASTDTGGVAATGGTTAATTTTGGLTSTGGTTATSTSTTPINWVGSWMTAQQLVESTNVPPVALANNTLRQIFQVSIGGSRIRLKFSNEFSTVPVTLKTVHAAKSVSTYTVDATTDKALTFNNGQSSVTIAAKGYVWSDPIAFTLAPLSKVAVSIFFGSDASATIITGHPGSRTTSYIQTGDGSAAASLTSPTSTDHWYYLAGLDVEADTSTRAVAILGDSITDGRGSTTNSNNRWTDNLAKRLQANAATTKVGVLNAGIGGNTILSGGLGPTASVRFDRDIIGQSGVKWAIIFEGVNDIGYASTTTLSTNLTSAYAQFVTKAHAAGLKAYGATITPFGGNGYYTADHETIRQAVNTWIRTPGNFDAVIDFDAAVKDPANAINLLATYSSDGLHLTPTGYQKMADSIDLTLFQ